MRKILAVLLLISLLMTTGCATLSPVERVEYDQVKVRIQQNALQEVQKKDPGVAAALNILPGVGNIYLGQWGWFVGNLLLWPYSVVWGVPQAYSDAQTQNKQETLAYYKYGAGKDILQAREKGNLKDEDVTPLAKQNVKKPE